MAISLTHTKVSAIADDAAASAAGEVLPSDWNAAHTLSQATATLLGRTTAGTGATEEISVGSGLSLAAGVLNSTRDVLSANRTYYVRTNGSDSNTGLADTAGGAFLTIQHGLDVIGTLDFNGKTVTLQSADGTYSGGFVVPSTVGQLAYSDLVISGNTTTPGNVVISNTTNFSQAIKVPFGARCLLQGLSVKATGTNGLGIYGAGGYCYFKYMDFGACSEAQLYCESGVIEAIDAITHTISGTSLYFLYCVASGFVHLTNGTYNNLAGRAYTFFAYAESGGSVFSVSCTFSGSAITGTRYASNLVGNFQTFGSGANYFPGDIAGFTANGGVYA